MSNTIRFATGESYIVAIGSKPVGFMSTFNENSSLKFPKVGEILDFTSHSEVWVCDKPYYTTGNGWSAGINVSGQKIKILKLVDGDGRVFSGIKFQILE